MYIYIYTLRVYIYIYIEGCIALYGFPAMKVGDVRDYLEKFLADDRVIEIQRGSRILSEDGSGRLLSWTFGRFWKFGVEGSGFCSISGSWVCLELEA